MLNDEAIIHKIVIRQNPLIKDAKGNLYPISVKIKDNDHVAFEEMFLKSNVDDDGTYVIATKTEYYEISDVSNNLKSHILSNKL